MSRILVKYRKLFFLLTTLLTVVSIFLIPHIHINADMTKYLPPSYPMKQGLDVMAQELPSLSTRMEEFGTLFADGNDLMPKDLPKTLAIGVGLLFVVLLVMSSSLMEVLLFLLATGFAVALNMGSNAFLPSVSNMTNSLTPVLQMVLSMDYCIILMNRYRQEKASGKEGEAAMQGAIGSAASSILSSAFTTIVSLLMLCFIRLKIGADLGIVLSKGVAFSLICNFTVLPFLILVAERAIEATRKKIPALPFAVLSRFEHRFRYGLLVLFIAIFAGFAYLQRRTVLSFCPQWESNATLAVTSSENAALLLYSNAEEAAVPALMDSLANLPGVHRSVSYPSLVLCPRTAAEMEALLGEFAPDSVALPEGMLPLVYYARFRPQRTERLSFREIEALADDLKAQGLIPGGFDPDALFPAPEPLVSEPEPSAPELPVEEPAEEAVEETAVAVADTLPSVNDTPALAAPVPEPDWNLLRAHSAAEMARWLELDHRQVSMLYRLAGKTEMTPSEMISFVEEKILPNRRYAAFLPKGTKEKMAAFKVRVEEAGLLAEAISETPSMRDIPADTLAAAPVTIPDTTDVPAVSVQPAPAPEAVLPPSPLEELAQMALSSSRYSSARVYAALSAAGVAVKKEQLDLLYLYAGAQKNADSSWRMSPLELLDFVADTLLVDPALESFVPDSARAMVQDAREQLLSGVGQLRGETVSGAVILSGYEKEGEDTFAFMDKLRALADETLSEPHYWIGESEMYKELKEGFPSELLLLTLLTVLSIFVIVAVNFRSVFIPIPLILTILAGVYVNVWASGLGGSTMYYLSYLVIQGILMGATIDYTILFTHYYLEFRREAAIPEALTEAYTGSSHSILTSGLILSIVPYVMSLVMKDPMMSSILSSLAMGAFAVVVLILFVLPGVMAALDPLLKKRK